MTFKEIREEVESGIAAMSTNDIWGELRAALSAMTEAGHYRAKCLLRASGDNAEAAFMRQYLDDYRGPVSTFDYDDGGYAAAKEEYGNGVGEAGSVRAIAIMTGLDYHTVYHAIWKEQLDYNASRRQRSRMPENMISPSRGVYTEVVRRFMTKSGYTWVATSGIEQSEGVHLAPDELPPKGRLLIQFSGHFIAVIDGIVTHSFNPNEGRDKPRMIYGLFHEPAADITWPQGPMNPGGGS